MWHEARKQEKKIRGLLVDYRRRAERRKEYYERIKLDPTQFIQLHGRNCKIHIDPSIHYAAEAPGSMMPWRGNNECLIDRFDVRAHLDEIPQPSAVSTSKTREEMNEDRQVNYERYRILVQNEFLGISEEKFLHQIRLEELYGPVVNKTIEEEKKQLAPKKAAIAFCYDETPTEANDNDSLDGVQMDEDKEDDSDDSDSDLDLDLTVDILALNAVQYAELNTRGVEYGMLMEDFMSLMQKDLDEAEALRLAKEHEDEKAMYSGRKSRKERRALKKKHLDRRLSPPSYAARSSPTYTPYHRSSSRSRSPSPPTTTQIKFITSFGGDSDKGTSDEMPDSRSSQRKRQTSRHSPPRRSTKQHSSSHSSRSRSPCYSSSRKSERSSEQMKEPSSRSRFKRSPDRNSSRSCGKSSWKSSSHSHSRSQKCIQSSHSSKKSGGDVTVKPPSPPVRRYYGRRGGKSDSDDADSDSEPNSNSSNVPTNYARSSSLLSKGSESTGAKSTNKPTPQELLRKKMKVLLKHTYKEDKKVQQEKAQKAEQERQDREEELRGISIKMRRRERERRHRLQGASDSDCDSRTPSPKRWHESDERRSRDLEYGKERRTEETKDQKDDYRQRETDRDEYRHRETDRDECRHRETDRDECRHREIDWDDYRYRDRETGRTDYRYRETESDYRYKETETSDRERKRRYERSSVDSVEDSGSRDGSSHRRLVDY